MTVKQFFYFDDAGITSLLNQATASQQPELIIDEMDRGDVFGDGARKIRQSLPIPDEKKLTQLYDCLSGRNELIELSTLLEIRAIASSVLPFLFWLHDLPLRITNYSPQSVHSGVLKDQFVSMQAPESNEFPIKLVVGAGLAKCYSVYRTPGSNMVDFGKTSHLSLLLREMATAPVHVNVFGHIRRTQENFHLKPYAMWF